MLQHACSYGALHLLPRTLPHHHPDRREPGGVQRSTDGSGVRPCHRAMVVRAHAILSRYTAS